LPESELRITAIDDKRLLLIDNALTTKGDKVILHKNGYLQRMSKMMPVLPNRIITTRSHSEINKNNRASE
jgi:hypothetical protein